MTIDGKAVSASSSVRDLGIHIDADLMMRITKGKAVVNAMGTIWKSKNITDELKLKVLRTCVFSVAFRACETWTLKKIDRNRLRAFEMYCYRRMLQISWTAKERNENITV